MKNALRTLAALAVLTSAAPTPAVSSRATWEPSFTPLAALGGGLDPAGLAALLVGSLGLLRLYHRRKA